MAGPSGGYGNNSTGGDYTHSSAVAALYFLLLGLLLGAITLFMHRKYLWFLPYPALIFIEGMLLGSLHEFTDHGLLDLSASIDVWNSIDPHLVAVIFLPALIFSDAMLVDVHLFKRVFAQAGLMATGGVALQILGIALVARYMLSVYGYLWDLTICFTFGAVLAITDPIAVVVMLNAVRAPAKLTTLLSGESHLSDLIALVTFNIMLNLSKDASYFTEAEIIQYCMSMLLGGPALGFLFGIVALYAIRLNQAKQREQDTLIQVTLTVCLAYFSFIVSENNAKGNGVLATVTSALIIAAYAWPSFARPDMIKSVWKTIEYFGSTIIFLLSGLFYGMIMVIYSGSYLPFAIYGHAIALWACVYAIRCGIMILFFPVLSRTGYGLTFNEGVIMTWGSLKGAVAFTLGLIVFKSDLRNASNPSIDEDREPVQFFFLVCSVVFLSTIINASTAPLLMRALKILSRSQVQKQLLRQVRTRVFQQAFDSFDELSKTAEYEGVEKSYLKGAITAFSDKAAVEMGNIDEKKPADNVLRKMIASTKRLFQSRKSKNKIITYIDIDGHKCDVELLSQVRELFFDIVRAKYWEMIEYGVLPSTSGATRTLLQSVDVAKDFTQDCLDDYKFLNLPSTLEQDESALHLRFFAAIDRCLPDWVTIDDYFGEKLHEALREDAVYIASSFIMAHEHAQSKLATYVGEGSDADSPEEIVTIAASERLVERARDFMTMCKKTDPHIVDLVKLKKVGSHVLTAQAELIEKLHSSGVVDEKTSVELHELIEMDFTRLRNITAGKRDAIVVTATGKVEDV